MEFLEIALSVAWKVTLILGCLTMSYAIASTLVGIIYKDILNKKEYHRTVFLRRRDSGAAFVCQVKKQLRFW